MAGYTIAQDLCLLSAGLSTDTRTVQPRLGRQLLRRKLVGPPARHVSGKVSLLAQAPSLPWFFSGSSSANSQEVLPTSTTEALSLSLQNSEC